MAEVIVGEDLVYVPDGVACIVCGFTVVTKQWKPGALCPFDRAALVRATWRQYAEYLRKRNDETVKVNHNLRESVSRFARNAGCDFTQ